MGREIDSYIKEQFGIAEVDIRTYSPLTLAYIGDGIYDLVIRSVVVGKGNTRAGELHKRTSQIVKAHTQAEMMEVLLPLLRRKRTFTGAAEMPSRRRWQRMRRCPTTARPPGLRR